MPRLTLRSAEAAYRHTGTKPGPNWYGHYCTPPAAIAQMLGNTRKRDIHNWIHLHTSSDFIPGFDCGWRLTLTTNRAATTNWIKAFYLGIEWRMHFMPYLRQGPI